MTEAFAAVLSSPPRAPLPIPLALPSFATPFDIHLQWFAAEDEGRTEEPSEHKLRKAREEGKVAKSAEVTSSLMLIVGIAAIAILSGSSIKTLFEMLSFFLSNATSPNAYSGAIMAPAFLGYLARIMVPILLVLFITAVLGNVIQVGFLFTVKPITPDVGRIVPRFGRWLQRSFGSQEAFFNLGKSIVKIAIIAVVAYLNISAELGRLTRLVLSPFLTSLAVISQTAFRIIAEAAIALLIFSFFDYLFQRRQHIESLKMSRQEVKEERKLYEGDPLIKSRLRERMREIMRRNMLKAVPKADVVITNPTHYAVALEYNRALMAAPTVVAKGADLIARKIREVAGENGVPIVENKPLAQALYKEVEIGDVIPEKFYEVMSTILAQVYKMSGKTAEAVV
jgi:flagellar biosynthetic protein FlhB